MGVPYDPSKTLVDGYITVDQPQDLQAVQQAAGVGGDATAHGTGVANAPADVVALLTRTQRFQELKNETEYQRLHGALMNRFAYTG